MEVPTFCRPHRRGTRLHPLASVTDHRHGRGRAQPQVSAVEISARTATSPPSSTTAAERRRRRRRLHGHRISPGEHHTVHGALERRVHEQRAIDATTGQDDWQWPGLEATPNRAEVQHGQSAWTWPPRQVLITSSKSCSQAASSAPGPFSSGGIRYLASTSRCSRGTNRTCRSSPAVTSAPSPQQ